MLATDEMWIVPYPKPLGFCREDIMESIERLVYRPAEVQAALGIKNTKFWALVKAGLLDTRKIGSATVVTAESLRAFVENLPKSDAA
jgi:hypothetical protein